MIDSLFQKKPRRHIQELNIVPILDMLTTVIFFLLLSTGFMEFTKHSIPPSATITVTDSKPETPLSPKLFLFEDITRLTIMLRWDGKNPGNAIETIAHESKSPKERALIIKATEKLIKNFSAEYPNEKTIQVGLTGRLPYQHLISLMDGIRSFIPDVVLISYNEAEAIAQATHTQGK